LLFAQAPVETGNPAQAKDALRQAGAMGIPKTLVDPPLARAMPMSDRHDGLLAEITVPQHIPAERAAELLTVRGNACDALTKSGAAGTEFSAALARLLGHSGALPDEASLSATTGDKAPSHLLIVSWSGSRATLKQRSRAAPPCTNSAATRTRPEAFAQVVALAPKTLEPWRGRVMAFMGMDPREKSRADLKEAGKFARGWRGASSRRPVPYEMDCPTAQFRPW
jgi:hypothetical protein